MNEVELRVTKSKRLSDAATKQLKASLGITDLASQEAIDTLIRANLRRPDCPEWIKGFAAVRGVTV